MATGEALAEGSPMDSARHGDRPMASLGIGLG